MRIDQNYFKTDLNKNINIEKELNKDEKILWKSKPKRISYALQKSAVFFPIALIWGAIDFTIISLIFKEISKIGVGMIFFIIFFFALHLMPVWIFIHTLYKSMAELKYNKYYITNQRIINQSGKSGIIINEMPLESIQSVNLKRSFWDKIFGVGDIYITGDTSSTVFFDIHDSEMIATKLYELSKTNKKELKNRLFYKYNVECEYCGSFYSKTKTNCPICGAKNPDFKQDVKR